VFRTRGLVAIAWSVAFVVASHSVTGVALGVAATGTVDDVFTVFGVWAVFSGAAQLVVALRRRAQLGKHGGDARLVP
jgi:uncharacterized membrane protein HdeD (DUF308 family)